MAITSAEIEGESDALYRRANVDPEREPGALRVARRLPGVRVELVPGLRSRGELESVGSGYLIRVRDGMHSIALGMAVGHECGHIARASYRDGEYAERVCDAIAAALIAPRPALFVLRLAFGLDLARMAETLCTSQTIVARRVAEVFNEPTAIVLPGRVLRDEASGMPGDTDLLRIVRAGGCDAIRVVRLTDARGAYLLIGRW